MLNVYRYQIETYENDEVEKSKGYVTANSYVEATSKLVDYCTAPSGKCSLTELKLYEVDNINGILPDSNIEETLKYENK